jgi:hypothetical protein
MSIYFHHVGAQAAAADFPRTIRDNDGNLIHWRFAEIADHMRDLSDNAIQHFRAQLERSGVEEFQIWGIPSGGERALSKLDLDDWMLLLASQQVGTRFEYAGKIIARAPAKSFDLSRYLWKSDRYPIVFLMDGQLIDYPWETFFEKLGYARNWQLRGLAFRVTDEKLRHSEFHTEGALLREIVGSGAPIAESKSDAETVVEDLAKLFADKDLGDTDRDALVKARLGQGRFREQVLAASGGRCAVTGCATLAAIRASHIRPWRGSTNAERLDPDNGLPLVANLDALFDDLLMTFDEHGQMFLSRAVPMTDRKILTGATAGLRFKPNTRQQAYLDDHRGRFAQAEKRRR